MSVIFDMDGVITDTAKIHFKAWKQVFDSILNEDTPFTLEDYIHYVDGMSRVDGVKYFLHSRQIINNIEALTLVEQELIDKLATEKNHLFLNLIKQEGVMVFPGTLSLINELKKNSIKIGVISSSKNCTEILTEGGVIQLFDVVVDGNVLKDGSLQGKPSPDIFLEAAKRLQVIVAQSIIIEDAMSGIIAGHAGHFGLVIGIDRQNKWQAKFQQKGADIVINDLSEITLDDIKQKLTQKTFFLGTDNFSSIKKYLKNKKVIICCDYDGTLTPIVKRPELANLSNTVKELLFQLHKHATVVIVSGRELSDIETKIGINGLYYAGNHGLEITGPEHFANEFVLGSEYLDDIYQAYQELNNSLSSIKNCIIENKKYSLSVHYRMVRESLVPDIEETVDKILKNYPKIVKYHGKKVFEIRPKLNWNKGKALEFILEKINYNPHDFAVIYLGDDVTDEDAFRVVKQVGIGILVSETPRETDATYRLGHPSDVEQFLKDLLANLLQEKTELVDSSWKLIYTEFEPEREKLREALCTLGNGYFATRGASEESNADEIHYPGTYFAGMYNKAKSIILGREIYNEDLVNMPNWLPLTFKILENQEVNDETAWFSLANVRILDYKQELDFQQGVLRRKLCIKDKKNRITHLEFTRFVSMANKHFAGQKLMLTAENWSGTVLIRSGLDASVTNSGVARYQELNSKHLELLKMKSYKSGKVSILVRTNQSHVEVGYSAIHRLYQGGIVTTSPKRIVKNAESIYCYFECDLIKGGSLKIEKLVAVAKNNDPASSDCILDSHNVITLLKHESFDALLHAHTLFWKKFWGNCDIKVESAGNDQQILRLHFFHLLQTVSRHSIDLDISVPARGLHGESYRGHIFWDELFIMPFYTFYFPEIVRFLLLYRYRRLNMARLLAKKAGYLGAMFPWQSGSNGDEATQLIHLNPRSSEWMADFSHYQRHVNAAIAYNIWQYYLVSNDITFMSEYGLEMIFEIARFWASIATFNQKIRRYEIQHVVGPDEYHEKYPWCTEPGINNNAYTNIMAVWTIERALELLKNFSSIRCQELRDQLQLSDQELARWNDVTSKMFIPFHETDIISQFSGYENLAEFDWESYQKKYGNIERLDRILKAENDSPDNYKVSKQADVIMLFYLFSYDNLAAIFKKLGYTFTREILNKNIFYYLKRTSHGSTLSKVVLASLVKYIDQEIALKFYQDVLNSDIMDTQGGTTPEGIHLGAMVSCLNINLTCFAGLEVKDNMLSFSPNLPDRVKKLQFNLQFRQQWIHVLIRKDKIDIRLRSDCKNPLAILINGKVHILQPISTPHVGEFTARSATGEE